jgi:putative nucleotidyltransferase with HDIG domain
MEIDLLLHAMTRRVLPIHSLPLEHKTQPRKRLQWLQRCLIEPSLQITQPDQRRQAALLSSFLLALIILAFVVEIITDLLIDWAGYTGYRQTAVTITCLTLVYCVSRTRYLQLAASLAVVVASLAVFLTGWAEPRGVVGGLFDFLILPLWLGSLFIDLKKLPPLILGVLGGLLLFPLAAPQVTLNDILIGPFAFISATSILLLIITGHRNKLEQDRRAELSSKELRSRREAARADALLRVADRLNAQLDLQAVLEAIGEEVARALNTDVSVVTLYDREQDQLYAAAGVGLAPEVIQGLPPFPRAVYTQTVDRHGRVFALPDLQAIHRASYLVPFKQANLRSMAFATMEYEQELIGSLSAISIGDRREFTKDDLVLLQGLADQAALALVNIRLYEDLQRVNDDLSQAYDSTIEGWSYALDLRDKETEGHTQRVAKMTLALARAMGISEDELVHVRRGALLHDIGKMGVPDQILLKPGKLTDEEWTIMRMHPVYAYDLLSPIAYLQPALDIPYCHHEKWDGTGYPRGLSGEQIPFAARLFALVDVWDALRSDRPYRNGWPADKVIEHIRSQAGTHFDPSVVEVFLRLVAEE